MNFLDKDGIKEERDGSSSVVSTFTTTTTTTSTISRTQGKNAKNKRKTTSKSKYSMNIGLSRMITSVVDTYDMLKNTTEEQVTPQKKKSAQDAPRVSR